MKKLLFTASLIGIVSFVCGCKTMYTEETKDSNQKTITVYDTTSKETLWTYSGNVSVVDIGNNKTFVYRKNNGMISSVEFNTNNVQVCISDYID